MKRALSLLPVLLFVACTTQPAAPNNLADVTSSLPAAAMIVTSPAFTDNAMIPPHYTCDAQNVSPPLSIADVPSNAKSLALILEDPDAPNGTFTHWIAWNIDPSNAEFPEGAIPAGTQEGMNGAQKSGYTGPCPPTGEHRYIFTVYALSTTLTLPRSTTVDQLRAALQNSIIAQATLVGRYARTNSSSPSSSSSLSQ